MGEDLILLIVSSPSGAGKTTLTHRLLNDSPDFRFSVSHTTRLTARKRSRWARLPFHRCPDV
ncbi:MAG: hypothetical protein R3A47_11555 [Polyangiales bacterium]